MAGPASDASVDYRKILKAYIEHVVDWEGTDFLPILDDDDLSDAEQTALIAVASEAAEIVNRRAAETRRRIEEEQA